MRPILVPTDFTSDSELAFEYARAIALDQCCDIIVLTVLHPDECSPGDRDGNTLLEASETFRNTWNSFLRLKDRAKGVPTSFIVRVGDIAEAIENVARENNCELVVIHAHSQSMPHRWMYPSVTERLIRANVCTVACLHHSPYRQEAASDAQRSKMAIPGDIQTGGN